MAAAAVCPRHMRGKGHNTILSCFAGAAAELTAALLVNPCDPETVATSISYALSMLLDERRARHQTMFRLISENDLKSWGDCYLRRKDADLQRPAPNLRALFHHAPANGLRVTYGITIEN
jgi:trehalose-6-phosphate synthase